MKNIPLGEIIKLEYGKPLPREDRAESGKYPAYGANGVKARTDKFYIDKRGIIVGRKGSAGVVTLTDGPFWPLDVTYYVTFDDLKYDLKYIYWLLTTLDLTSLAVGVKPGINRNEIYSLSVPMPVPISEQRQIAKTLDETFEKVDDAIELTAKNLKNTSELFESKLSEVISRPSVEEVRLSDVAESITDGDHMPPPKEDRGIPFITISNINKKTHEIDFSNTFKVPRTYFDNIKPSRKPKTGDLLYTVTGSYGIPVLVSDAREFCFQRHIALIRPGSEMSSEWLYYWMVSSGYKQAQNAATGTAQKTVSLTALRNFKIPRVSVTQQLNDVAKLRTLREETMLLAETYEKKIYNLKELKVSLHSKAFKGSQ